MEHDEGVAAADDDGSGGGKELLPLLPLLLVSLACACTMTVGGCLKEGGNCETLPSCCLSCVCM